MTKKGRDIFEKLFGKEPETGYIFSKVNVSFGMECIILHYTAQGIGFGEMILFFEDKKIKVDTEHMTKDFCDALVAETVRKLEEEESKVMLDYDTKVGLEFRNIQSHFLQSMYENVSWEIKGE